MEHDFDKHHRKSKKKGKKPEKFHPKKRKDGFDDFNDFDSKTRKPKVKKKKDRFKSNKRIDRFIDLENPEDDEIESKRRLKSKKSITVKKKHKNQAGQKNDLIRLNKFIANSGICSRREADKYIESGAVMVNDTVVSELGTKIKPGDEVSLNGKPVSGENKVYILFNKPKNCISTAKDPQGRPTVLDYVGKACKQRVFPVGRLDRNTTGVLLLTNDGELTEKLTHPKYNKKKIYHVWLDKNLTLTDMEQIAKGVELDDGLAFADGISYIDDDKKQVGLEIHSGKNHIVRRIFEHLGYEVRKLDRVYFAGLTKKGLNRGKWRFLKEHEVSLLKMNATK